MILRIDSFVTLRCLPSNSLYTKPFKSKLRLLFGFLLLVCLRKRAFDTVSKQKTRHFRDRLCREEGIRTLDTVARIHTFQACSFNHSDTSLFFFHVFVHSFIVFQRFVFPITIVLHKHRNPNRSRQTHKYGL